MSSTTINTINANSLLQDFDLFTDLYGKQTSSFQELRKFAADKFNNLGVPTQKNEEWKYLNLSPLLKNDFRSVSHTDGFEIDATSAKQFHLSGENAFVFIIENGRLNKAASNVKVLPKGLTIGTLSELANDVRVQKHFAQHADASSEPFVALNTAMSFDAMIVLVDEKIIINEAIQFAFVTNVNQENISVPIRVLVIAGKHAECTVVESYHSLNNQHKVFVNAVSEVVIGEEARVHYSKIQNESENTFHINYHQVNQAKKSYQHITTLSLGAALLRNNLHIRLDDENCTSYLNGLYVLTGTQVMDNHTLVDHAMPNCYSNELYKGIIDDKSQGVFNGKIFVRKDAQKTNAYQSNKNILLSNDASINTKPQLEIFADDVKCSHGATTGQIDEEALFYLRSRGIAEPEARALLNHAFAAAVIDQVENESLKESLLLLLSRKLRVMEEV